MLRKRDAIEYSSQRLGSWNVHGQHRNRLTTKAMKATASLDKFPEKYLEFQSWKQNHSNDERQRIICSKKLYIRARDSRTHNLPFNSPSRIPSPPWRHATFFSNHSSHCSPEKLELIPFSTTPSKTTVGVT